MLPDSRATDCDTRKMTSVLPEYAMNSIFGYFYHLVTLRLFKILGGGAFPKSEKNVNEF